MHPAITTLVLTLGLVACWPASAQTDCGGTRAVLWLHVPADALEDLLNRAVPESMEGGKAIDIRLLTRGYLSWSMIRSPITLVTERDRLLAYTTGVGGVRAKGEIPIIGKEVSAEADLAIDANIALRPVLGSDWCLHPNVSANATVMQAMARVLGLEISVGNLSQLALDEYLARIEERINGSVANGQFLRTEMERIWKSMHRVDRISVAQLPGDTPAWFVARPTRIGATDLRMNEAGLDFGVAIFAETEFVIGEEPRLTPQPLPPLEFAYDLPTGHIELALPVFVDWNTVNGLIALGLEDPVVYERNYARLEVAEAGLSHGPGESVLVSAVVTAGPKGFIGWILYIIQRILIALGLHTDYFGNYGDHQIAISVRPAVSDDGRRIVFRDAGLMPESAYLMDTLAADYAGLTAESLRTSIERQVVLNLDERLAEAETMAREKAGEITRKFADRGLGLDLEIRPGTRLASVSARPEGLVARFCAAADVDATILRLGF